MANPEISSSISNKVTDKIQGIASKNSKDEALASELYHLNYLSGEIENLKSNRYCKWFPIRLERLKDFHQRILDLLDLIEKAPLSAPGTKYFRAQIENDLYDFKRPWYLFPFTPWIRATRNAYYSQSVTQKVMAGLSISSAITLAVLISTISFRIFALQGENNSRKGDYQVLLSDLALIQNQKREILNLKASLNDQNALLQSISIPAKQSSPGGTNKTDSPSPDQNSGSSVIQKRLEQDTFVLRETLGKMYKVLGGSYSTFLGSNQTPSAQNPSQGAKTSNSRSSLLISELNVLLFKASNDSKSTASKMSDIFLYIDNSTKTEEIINSIQKQDEIMDIISRRLSDNTAIFSSNGVQDGLAIILIVAAFGILGSITSIIIRVQNVSTDPRFGAVQSRNDKGSYDWQPASDPLVPLLSGLFRPLIGAFSSIFIFALISSGIISTTLFSSGNSFYLFIAISFVSGFSERWFIGWVKKAEGIIGESSSQSVTPASQGDTATSQDSSSSNPSEPGNQGPTDKAPST